MKNRNLKLLTGSAILSTLLLSGCGGGADSGVTKQPHDTSKLGRMVSVERDWTWDVSSKAVMKKDGDISIFTNFWAGLPDNIENFQYFIDMDSNIDTGYNGSNGWEVKGADYLIENGDVYKSLSNSEWNWELIGTLQTFSLDNYPNLSERDSLLMRNATPTLTNIFNTDSFKVMIEVYDKNWEGDNNTITGIVADLKVVGGVDLSAVEEEIRAKYNAKFTTVTTIDFAPNNEEAIVMMINKWTGKKMYLVDVSNIDVAIPIAEEYAKKFIYKTNVVKENGVVEFQIKEESGIKYQIVYDYKNNSEISKTLIEGNPENVKNLLVKKSFDIEVNQEIEYAYDYKYNIDGSIKSISVVDDIEDNWIPHLENAKYSYGLDGKLNKKVEKFYEGVVTTYYDSYENPTKIEGVNYTTFISYNYDINGRILSRTERYSEQEGVTKVFNYRYHNGDLEVISTDGSWISYVYNQAGQKISEFKHVGNHDANEIVSSKSYKYSDSKLHREYIDENYDGIVETELYYIYKDVDLSAQ